MRYTTKAILLGVFASTALLAGCSMPISGSGDAGGQQGGSGTSSSNGASQDLHGAPKVQQPLETSKFQASPCSVLTTAQLKTLGITNPGKTQDAGGPSCDWQETSSPKQLGVTVTAQTGNSHGLGKIYENQSKHQLGVFESIGDIEGYPAVIFSNGSGDNRLSGNCEIAVGVTDKLEYTIGNSVSDKSDPCATGKQIAQMVVQTLKGGS